MAAFIASERRERTLRNRKNPMELYTNDEIISEFRLDKASIEELTVKLENRLGRTTMRSNALSVQQQILIALKTLASGSFQNTSKDCINVSQPTVSKVLANFLDAVLENIGDYIYMPSLSELNQLKQDFYDVDSFPQVIGCIDGSHIPMIAPSVNEHNYICRKGFHSINIQAVCDKNMIFMDVVAKWPGNTHDSFILQQSCLYDAFESGQFGSSVLLGDSGYSLRRWLMTPILSTSSTAEERYNRAHKRTRVYIERAFGILKQRWRIIDHTGGYLCYEPLKVCKITLVCCALHNLCRRKCIPILGGEISELPVVISETEASNINFQDGRDVRSSIVATFA